MGAAWFARRCVRACEHERVRTCVRAPVRTRVRVRVRVIADAPPMLGGVTPPPLVLLTYQVRLLLLFQKAVAEGGRSMVYECAQVADQMKERAAAGARRK
eukprot:6211349-Pleurochrysis_carterae.AAC.5